mgnify:CR=1 FL=1
MSRKLNILLVEDNKLDAMFFTRALGKVAPDAKVFHAKDGMEALEMLRETDPASAVERPFVTLVDSNMPRMNGHEYLENLRALDSDSDSVVFMFTTSDSPPDRSLDPANRVNGYFVKPQNSKGLKTILQTIRDFWSICETPEPAASSLQAS